MGHPDEDEWRAEEAMMDFLDEQLREIAEAPVISYLARYGDAIQARVDACVNEAGRLLAADFPGASLVRAAAGLEIAVRFFLARPLVQGAFMSDEWAQALASRILNGRGAEDRDLLPAILRNWGVDITTLHLANGAQMWETVITETWPARNDYVHKGADVPHAVAAGAAEALDVLMGQVVGPIARKLRFTREETGKWSVVLSQFNRELNPPEEHETASPF
jgi:hypothetical protein